MKSPFASKLNIVGAVLTLSGLLMDPTFQGYLSTIVPQEVMAKIISISGIVVMVLRTFFSTGPTTLNLNKDIVCEETPEIK